MVNTQLLENKIEQSGKTKTFLAGKIGRSLQAFNTKIKNKYEFSISEVAVLCKELDIEDLSEKEEIFFAVDVDK